MNKQTKGIVNGYNIRGEAVRIVHAAFYATTSLFEPKKMRLYLSTQALKDDAHEWCCPHIAAPRGLLIPKPIPTAAPTIKRPISRFTIKRLRLLSCERHEHDRFILCSLAFLFQWPWPGHTCDSLRPRQPIERRPLISLYFNVPSVVEYVIMASISVSNGLWCTVAGVDRSDVRGRASGILVLERPAFSLKVILDESELELVVRPAMADNSDVCEVDSRANFVDSVAQSCFSLSATESIFVASIDAAIHVRIRGSYFQLGVRNFGLSFKVQVGESVG